MTGVFGPTPTQKTLATQYSSEPSVNSKRKLNLGIQSLSPDKIIKKLKKEQINDDEDNQIFQDDKTTQQSEISLFGSPEDSLARLNYDEISTVEEKAPKRKRYGNWLREIVNHVCKLLKLRLLSLKSLSKALNDHGGHSEHLNDTNSFALSLPNLNSDIFETFKHDRRADSETFTAFLEGFGKIKRNTYKMTEEYISRDSVFGERLVKAILDFIPETDQISTNSQYLNWIKASTRMKKATKDSLLDTNVRAALIRPLRKLYRSLTETNLKKANHQEMDSVYNGSFIESKINNHKANLNLIADERGEEQDSPNLYSLREDETPGSGFMKIEAPFKNENEMTIESFGKEDDLSKKEEENSRETLLKNPYNNFSSSKMNESLNAYSLSQAQVKLILIKQLFERLIQNQLQNINPLNIQAGFGTQEHQQELMQKLLRKLLAENGISLYGQ